MDMEFNQTPGSRKSSKQDIKSAERILKKKKTNKKFQKNSETKGRNRTRMFSDKIKSIPDMK